MTGRTFWILSFVLLVVASHLAYVLFGTRLDSQSSYQELVVITGTNKIYALNANQAKQLSATSDSKLVHAVCAFDLSRGPVLLAAKFPDSYWSVNIYSLGGDVIYTLNDRQANTGNLSIKISQPGNGSSEQAIAGSSPSNGNEIDVVTDNERGLVVLRGSIMHERQRQRVAETLSQSECGLANS